MEKPTECRWCGCGDIEDQSSCMQSVIVTFACGSMSDVNISETRWLRDSRCAGQVGNLYKRIRRAVQVLEGSDRIMMMLDDDDEDVSFVVPSTDVDRAVGILGGEEDDDINSSKSSDSSPVTTDDLAVSDYYEAVRQRVPWMVSVEHIEGLIEGYRRCGVMVWQAAEQIQRIYGG